MADKVRFVLVMLGALSYFIPFLFVEPARYPLSSQKYCAEEERWLYRTIWGEEPNKCTFFNYPSHSIHKSKPHPVFPYLVLLFFAFVGKYWLFLTLAENYNEALLVKVELLFISCYGIYRKVSQFFS